MRIQNIKANNNELHNAKIQTQIETLIGKIYEARNARTSWTPAIESVINFLAQYQGFCISHREHILNCKTFADPNIFDGATKLCKFGTETLGALTQEIKESRIDLNIGKRSVAALQGLGLIVAGIICAVLTVAIGVLLAPGISDPEVRETLDGIAGKTKNCFIDAFASFKETFTGKAECQELKHLASEVKKMNDDMSRFSPQSKPFSIFAQGKNRKEPSNQLLPLPANANKR